MEELEGLGADVTTEMIQGLLSARAPRLLDEGSEEFSQLITCVRGALTEIVPLVGRDPAAGPKRDLAIRAVVFCAAADLEASLYPEQQGPGDSGRANFLLGKYRDLRKQLAETSDDADGSSGSTGALPRGSFPPANPYPDSDRRDYGGGWMPGFRRNVLW